jgi:hypothetical protein
MTNDHISMLNPKSKYYQIPNNFQIPNPKRNFRFWNLGFGIYLVVLVLLGFGISSSAWAAAKDSISVRADVDRKTIYIGDRIRFTVEAVAGKDYSVEFPHFADNKIGDLEIKDSGQRERRLFFGKKVYDRWYSITSYAVGKHTISEVAVKFKPRRGKDLVEKKTKPIEISVVSIIPKDKIPSDIKDIKGPLAFKEINWLAVAIILAVLSAWPAFVMIRKRMRKMPPKLPHETALEELEAIRCGYAKGGQVKEYYVGVSDCIRRYIERVFGLKAPEMTTEEFLNSLKESAALNSEQKDLLKNFLKACDLVKFARYAPTAAEAESVYISAKKFVEETKAVIGSVKCKAQSVKLKLKV